MRHGELGSTGGEAQRGSSEVSLGFRQRGRVDGKSASATLLRGPSVATCICACTSCSNGIIGSELVYEHVHMTPLGNYLLAREMFRQIASKFPVDAGRPPDQADVPSEAECEQLLAFTGHDRTRIAAEMLDRLQKPPFTNQLNHSDQVLRLMLKAQDPAEGPDETVAPLPNMNGRSGIVPRTASCTTTMVSSSMGILATPRSSSWACRARGMDFRFSRRTGCLSNRHEWSEAWRAYQSSAGSSSFAVTRRRIRSMLSKFSMAISSSVMLTENVSSRKDTKRKTANEPTIPALVNDSSSEKERTPTISAIGITKARIWSLADSASFIPSAPNAHLPGTIHAGISELLFTEKA